MYSIYKYQEGQKSIKWYLIKFGNFAQLSRVKEWSPEDMRLLKRNRGVRNLRKLVESKGIGKNT